MLADLRCRRRSVNVNKNTRGSSHPRAVRPGRWLRDTDSHDRGERIRTSDLLNPIQDTGFAGWVDGALARECFLRFRGRGQSTIRRRRSKVHAMKTLFVAAAVDLFREWAAVALARCTAYEYGRYVDRLVLVIGALKLAAVKPMHLAEFKTWHEVQAVQRFFSWCVEQGFLKLSPATGLRRPPLGNRRRVLSRLELVRLLRACSTDLRGVVLFLAESASRPGEACKLRWSEYEARPSPHFVVRRAKGLERRREAGVRIIPVSARLARYLARRRVAEDVLVFRWREIIDLSVELRAWSVNLLQRRFRDARRLVGLHRGVEPVVLYHLRHTRATRLCAAGVRDRMLGELLGHSDGRMVRKYQHPDAADVLEAFRDGAAAVRRRERRRGA